MKIMWTVLFGWSFMNGAIAADLTIHVRSGDTIEVINDACKTSEYSSYQYSGIGKIRATCSPKVCESANAYVIAV